MRFFLASPKVWTSTSIAIVLFGFVAHNSSILFWKSFGILHCCTYLHLTFCVEVFFFFVFCCFFICIKKITLFITLLYCRFTITFVFATLFVVDFVHHHQLFAYVCNLCVCVCFFLSFTKGEHLDFHCNYTRVYVFFSFSLSLFLMWVGSHWGKCYLVHNCNWCTFKSQIIHHLHHMKATQN